MFFSGKMVYLNGGESTGLKFSIGLSFEKTKNKTKKKKSFAGSISIG